MELTFLYSPTIVREWDRHRLSDSDLRALEEAIEKASEAPPVVRGTGGLCCDSPRRRGTPASAARYVLDSLTSGPRAARIFWSQSLPKMKRGTSARPNERKLQRDQAGGKEFQMRRPKRSIARKIITDLKELNATLEAGIPLHEKYTFRTARAVPDPGNYAAADVRRTRELVGVSQPVFARMLGVSPALVRSWECGQRKPAPIARRMLDLIRANPSPLADHGRIRVINGFDLRRLLGSRGWAPPSSATRAASAPRTFGAIWKHFQMGRGCPGGCQCSTTASRSSSTASKTDSMCSASSSDSERLWLYSNASASTTYSTSQP